MERRVHPLCKTHNKWLNGLEVRGAAGQAPPIMIHERVSTIIIRSSTRVKRSRDHGRPERLVFLCNAQIDSYPRVPFSRPQVLPCVVLVLERENHGPGIRAVCICRAKQSPGVRPSDSAAAMERRIAQHGVDLRRSR